MNIEFDTIHIENFLSLGVVDVDFKNKGFIQIEGINENTVDSSSSNGSGKSSIFEALIWCITGSTIRGTRQVVNQFGLDGTYVELKFYIDNILYEVIRTKDHSIFKTNLKIKVNGEDKSGKGLRESEKILEEYLPGLTNELLTSIVVLGQGLPNKFTANSPSGRKQILEKFTNQDFIFEDLQNRITLRKNSLSNEILDKTKEISSTEGFITSTKERIDFVTNQLKSLDDIDISFLDRYSSSIEEYSLDLDSLQKEYKTIKDELENKKTDRSNINNSFNEDISSLDAIFSPILNDLEININIYRNNELRLQNEITALDSVQTICPTCGQPLVGVTKIDTSSKKDELYVIKNKLKELLLKKEETQQDKNKKEKLLKEKYNDIITKLCDEIKELQLRVEDNEKRQKEKQSYIDSLKEKLQKLQIDIATSNVRRADWNNQLVELNNSLRKYEEELSWKQKQFEKLNERKSAVDTINTILKKDFRSKLLQDIVENISYFAKEYCKVVFGTELLDFVLDDNRIDILYNMKEYESLSGGEKQKIDVIIQFAIKKFLNKFSGITTNILVLDEIFDQLDFVGCQKLIDLISTELNDVSTLYIITHRNDLGIPQDYKYTIRKKSDGISYIEFS